MDILQQWLSGSKRGTGAAHASAVPVEKKPDHYVLVPPLFERNNRDRDRFLYSSYEYQFAKRQLLWLFSDYVSLGQCQGALLLSPPQERHVSVEARIAPSSAAMCLRYQPKLHEQATFLAVTVNPQSPEKATFGASLFHPQKGIGAFATAPLAKRLTGSVAQAGLRYSSPFVSTGVVAEPARSALSNAWLVGRHMGLVAGVQLRLTGLDSLAALADPDTLRNRSCIALAYEPPNLPSAGAGRFCAAVEMREGKSLVVSFYQHMAFVRRHINPLEDRTVVGITNYVDLGIQIDLDVSESDVPKLNAAAASSGSAPKSAAATGSSSSSVTSYRASPEDPTRTVINAAAAWQINKNWLVKARAGDQSAGVATAFKTWGQAGLVAAASVSVRYDKPWSPVYGATLVLENFGERRYERGTSRESGRAVLQRHEANEVDMANMEGSGRVVIREALESEYNPQVADTTANYL